MTENKPKNDRPQESFDSVQGRHYRQCVKEAKFAAAVLVIVFIYCTAVVVNMGYLAPAERPLEPEMVWGIPEWVFWGVFLPWSVMVGVIWWFALFFLKDDEPLLPFPGGDSDGPESTGE